MRRKDREITDRGEMEAILAEVPVCRVAFVDGSEPYVVPLCFGHEDGTIWFHSAKEGRKMAILAKNQRCCVEVDVSGGPIPAEKPCSWEFRYKSVICTGTAEIVDDPAGKRRGLNCILAHYGKEEYPFTDADLGRVCVVRIRIDGMTGKKHGY